MTANDRKKETWFCNSEREKKINLFLSITSFQFITMVPTLDK